MIFNKKLAVAVSGAVLLMAGQFALADSTTDIVDALVSKGVLTEEEGKLITKGATSKAKADEKAMKSKINISNVIDNATLYGDVRVRFEDREASGHNLASGFENDYTRQRARYKMTLGVKTTSQDFYSDLAIAMGSGGRSDNATFGKSATSYNDKEIVYIKRAMLGWNAKEWLTLEAGRMDNPFWTHPAFMDADLGVEGLVEKVKYKVKDTEIFFTAGQLQYKGDRINQDAVTTTTNTNTAEFYKFQLGAAMPLTEKSSARAAITWTAYGNNPTTPFKAMGSATAYSSMNTQGTNDLSLIEIPAEFNFMASNTIGIRPYGHYQLNTKAKDRAQSSLNNGGLGDDSDDTAWVVGIKVASAQDLKAFSGNKSKQGDWSANLWYQEVGVWGADPNLVDSDFMDSRVNTKGIVFKGQYNIQDNVYINVAAGHAKRLNDLYGTVGQGDISQNLKDFDLYQLDLTYKF